MHALGSYSRVYLPGVTYAGKQVTVCAYIISDKYNKNNRTLNESTPPRSLSLSLSLFSSLSPLQYT